jgi:hypothetical protein
MPGIGRDSSVRYNRDLDADSRRRRFQFRLSTLMIVVTLLAVACGFWFVFGEVRTAHERKAALTAIQNGGGDYQPLLGPKSGKLPFICQWCGDVSITTIWLPKSLEKTEAEHIKRLFPEAQFLGRSEN